MRWAVGIGILLVVVWGYGAWLSLIPPIYISYYIYYHAWLPGYRKGVALRNAGISLEQYHSGDQVYSDVDFDRDWVGAAAARAETIIVSGILQERK